jgi:putative transcriptional regulator
MGHTLTPIAAAARTATGLSQQAFADKYLIPVWTLRKWEQEAREPDSAAITYLRLIAAHPQAVAKLIKRLPPI